MVDFRITRTVAKIVRNELQLNVEEIASRVGCKPGTILQLETGHWLPASGKVFDYYERQWTAISDFNKQKSARILGLTLDPEPVKHKPKRKIRTVKSKKYVRDDQYAMGSVVKWHGIFMKLVKGGTKALQSTSVT